MGHGFVFAVHGKNPCHTFDIFNPSQQAKWRKEHGNTILDFGAGHLTETNILNAAGFDCTPFEPYHIGVSEIDKGKSLGISKKFLEVVASGKEFTSVFISSVLNSVLLRRIESISSVFALPCVGHLQSSTPAPQAHRKLDIGK